MKHLGGLLVLIGLTVGLGYTLLAGASISAARNRSALGTAGALAIRAGTRERLFFATGEYDCKRDWDAIVRMNDISNATDPSVRVREDVKIPVKQLADEEGVALNFVHNIYVHEQRDEMYVASLFTGINPGESACDTTNMEWETGSVAVIDNIGRATSETTTLTRHIYGENTGLVQPHGIWVDESRELLYIANTHGGTIVVYEDAYSVDGNVTPTRVISSTKMKAPTHIYVDEEADRMYVANFSGELLRLERNQEYPDDGTLPSVLVFDHASTLDGLSDEHLVMRIVDNDGEYPDPTRLREGVAHITHNVWFDKTHNLLFVVHHTNEVLIYDLSLVGTPGPGGCLNPLRCALPPRAIVEVGSDTPTEYFSAYGLFYRPQEDRLYVTVGRTDAAPETEAGHEIVAGSPPNVILVYENVSTYESKTPTAFEPARRIHYESGQAQYYPPQPLWVTVDYPAYLPFLRR